MSTVLLILSIALPIGLAARLGVRAIRNRHTRREAEMTRAFDSLRRSMALMPLTDVMPDINPAERMPSARGKDWQPTARKEETEEEASPISFSSPAVDNTDSSTSDNSGSGFEFGGGSGFDGGGAGGSW